MRGKIYAKADADRLLPLVRQIVRAVRARHRLVRRKQAELLRVAGATAKRDGDRLALVRVVQTLRREIASGIAELEALGCALRDADRGVVEVLGELRGEIVYLTWCPGEPSFANWHPLDTSYLARTPIRMDMEGVVSA